jgi:hypothetical protein
MRSALGCLSKITPKASIIRLRNSTDPIGFLLKVIELLIWHTCLFYLKVEYKLSKKMGCAYLFKDEKSQSWAFRKTYLE